MESQKAEPYITHEPTVVKAFNESMIKENKMHSTQWDGNEMWYHKPSDWGGNISFSMNSKL